MKIIQTERAPAAIGPYSQAVAHGSLVFVSGQIPLDPSTGALVEGTIQDETRRVLENLKAVVEASGSSLDRVLKCTVFLKDLGDFANVNEIYAEYFAASKPARACVEVSALPKGVRVEIDAICTTD